MKYGKEPIYRIPAQCWLVLRLNIDAMRTAPGEEMAGGNSAQSTVRQGKEDRPQAQSAADRAG